MATSSSRGRGEGENFTRLYTQKHKDAFVGLRNGNDFTIKNERTKPITHARHGGERSPRGEWGGISWGYTQHAR